MSGDSGETGYQTFLGDAKLHDQGYGYRQITLSNFFHYDPETQVDIIIARGRIIDFMLYQEFHDVDARRCILYNWLGHHAIEIYLTKVKAAVLRAPDSTLRALLAQERAEQLHRCVPIQRAQCLSGRVND